MGLGFRVKGQVLGLALLNIFALPGFPQSTRGLVWGGPGGGGVRELGDLSCNQLAVGEV